MKYAIILPDGAADEACEALGGRTPLEVARKPHMDEVARSGQLGLIRTVPKGFTPASDVATLSVLGYDPCTYYTGRAPIEAAARDIPVGADDLVFRCNLCTVLNERMENFSAGHIGQQDAEALIAALNERLADDRVRFHAGVMYRHLLVLKQGRGLDVTCTPPHDIPSQAVAGHLPRGPDAAFVSQLMVQAGGILTDHPVNVRRRREGSLPANTAWLWGQGPRPTLPSFEQRFKIRGSCIAAVDLIRGLAALIGWRVLTVKGATGYLDTDYAAKGRRAVQALDDHDLVAVHIEAPDEAGHNGDAAAKVHAIEQIDAHIVDPILDRLLDEPAWRLVIVPDHPTPVTRRTHTADPPLFCMTGSDLEPGSGLPFDEANAAATGLIIDPGHSLMPRFLSPRPGAAKDHDS